MDSKKEETEEFTETKNIAKPQISNILISSSHFVMNAKPTCSTAEVRRMCGAPPRGRRRYWNGVVQLHFPL
jgi:hypothetical protein